MNIGALAELTGTSPDTLRYYEREGLIEPPARGANGYRSYGPAHAERVRFVRSAQALGFSLAEIRWIVPRLAAGVVDRGEIERHLQAKIAEIDAHMRQLRSLKRELLATFASLACTPAQAVAMAQATAKPSEAARAHVAARRALGAVSPVAKKKGAQPPAQQLTKPTKAVKPPRPLKAPNPIPAAPPTANARR